MLALALITCLVKHFFKAMKKIIVSTIVALFAITSFTSKGEILTSRSFYKEGPRMTWFVRGGVSLNMVGGDYVKYWKDEDRSFGMKPGFDISAGFERFFGKKNLYWGLELGIGTRGFSAKYEKEYTDWVEGKEVKGTDTYKASLSNINVKLPIFIGYCHPIGEHMKIDAHVGPYVSYDFTKSAKDDDGNVFGGYGDSFKYNHADVVGVDAGAAVGLGFWYDHFLIDVTYQKGFIETVNYGGEKGTASHLLIRIGYGF